MRPSQLSAAGLALSLAQVLAEKGIAAFVLKNGLQSSGYAFDVEGLADMQRAIPVVRNRAAEWVSNPARLARRDSQPEESSPSSSRCSTIRGSPMQPISSNGSVHDPISRC